MGDRQGRYLGKQLWLLENEDSGPNSVRPHCSAGFPGLLEAWPSTSLADNTDIVAITVPSPRSNLIVMQQSRTASDDGFSADLACTFINISYNLSHKATSPPANHPDLSRHRCAAETPSVRQNIPSTTLQMLVYCTNVSVRLLPPRRGPECSHNTSTRPQDVWAATASCTSARLPQCRRRNATSRAEIRVYR